MRRRNEQRGPGKAGVGVAGEIAGGSGREAIAGRVLPATWIKTRRSWMTHLARNVTNVDNGFLRGKRYLILDRDGKYSDAFRSVLVREGIHVIRLPPRSPNLNAFCERFVRSIKEECLSRMIFFGRASLRYAVAQYMNHYHRERNYQGIGNRLLQPIADMGELHDPVKLRQRLGGMLSYYHRAAA
jgi:putative transposase